MHIYVSSAGRHTNYTIKNQKTAMFAAIIFIVALAVHTSYIANGFTWLDHGDIEGGRAIVDRWNFSDVFLSRFGETGFYRPVITILNSLDAQLYGLWAPGYHITNALLHMLATAAAMFFAFHFFGLSRKESLVAGLVVGIHPLSWLPVGAISYRPELVVTLFIFLAGIFYIKARTGGKAYIPLTALCALLAFFSKETALFWLPALCIVWEYTSGQRFREYSKFLACALLIAGALYVGLRLYAVPEFWKTPAPHLNVSEAVGTRITALGFRIQELATPLRPPLSDAISPRGIFSLPVALVFALGVVISILLYRGMFHPLDRNALLFLSVALLPALNILPLPRFNSPHYGYFATLGVSVLAISLMRKWKLAKIFIALWISVAAVNTFAGGFSFKNDETLFLSEVQKDPAFREGEYYLGNYYFFEKNDIEEAGKHYEAALQKHDDSISYVDTPSLLINLAGVRLGQKRFQEADELLAQANEYSSPTSRFFIAYNRALIAYSQEDYKRVIEFLEPYKEVFPRPEPRELYERALEKEKFDGVPNSS